MKTVKQKFFRPNRYRGGYEYSLQDLAEYVANSNAMLAAGLHVPIFGVHEVAGSEAGGPQFEQTAKNVEGWVKGFEIDDEGWVSHILEVDDELFEKIRQGKVKFTSPELRPNFIDGLGRQWGNVFAHVAFTPFPRNPDQGPFQFAMQFSLDEDDMAEQRDDERVEDAPAEEVTETPADAPSEADTNEGAPSESPAEESTDTTLGEQTPEAEAVAAALRTVADSLIVRLGIAYNGDVFTHLGVVDLLVAIQDKLGEMEPKNPPPVAGEEAATDPSTEYEEEMPPQFSLKLEKMERELAHERHLRQQAAVRQRVKDATIPPVIRKKLLAKIDAVQFSNSENPTCLTIAEVIGMVDSLPRQFSFEEAAPPESVASQVEQAKEAELMADYVTGKKRVPLGA